MNSKKIIKTATKIAKVAPFLAATAGVLSLAFSKYEEKQGNYSREFPEIENELKQKIDEVRTGYGEKI